MTNNKYLHLITLGRYFEFSIAYFLPLFDKSALLRGPFETEIMHFYKLLGVLHTILGRNCFYHN